MKSICYALLFVILISLNAETALCATGQELQDANNGFDRTYQDSPYKDLINHFQIEIPKQMNAKGNVGVAVALTDENGIIWAQGFGYTDNDEKYKVDEETLFGLESITKVFNAISILIAYQNGLLDLDIPIANYLPGFHFNSKFEEKPENKITLRHLLCHKSGLQADAPVGNTYDWQPNYSWRSISFDEHIASINNTWLRSPVGKEYFYSNCGADLSGYILQTQSKMDYAEYVKKNLFEPLQIEKSLFNPEYNDLNRTHIAIGHAPGYEQIPWYTPQMQASSLYSNVIEVSKLIRLFLNNGKFNNKIIIDSTILSQMYQIPFNNDFSISPSGYGLGIEIQTKNNTFLYGHSGGAFGFGARALWYPKYKLGVVVLTNSMSGLSYDLAEKILDEAVKINTKSKSRNKSETINYKTNINSYIGNYTLKRGGLPEETLTVKVSDGKLLINDLELEEVEKGVFYTSKGDVLIFKNENPVWNNLKIEKLPEPGKENHENKITMVFGNCIALVS
jgi:CubicO group peptidase (beta-lactamase class C family)